MKKAVTTLSIAIIVLTLLQLVMMFVPTFTLTRAATKKNPDPQPEDFSIMSLCFAETEEMGKIFKKMVEDYDVNTNVEYHVLALAFGILAIAFNLIRISNDASGFQTAYATFMRFLTHVITFVWAYFGVNAFSMSQVMQFSSSLVPTVCHVAFISASVLAVVRLVLLFVPKFVSKKKVAA